MRLFLIAMLAFGIRSTAGAADDDRTTNERTDGFLNGRFWTMKGGSGPFEENGKGTMILKAVFVLGVNEGVTNSADPQEVVLYVPKTLTVKEEVAALDAFYTVTENLPVPVVWAISVVSLRSIGGSTAEVEALTARLRRIAAGIPDSFVPERQKK